MNYSQAYGKEAFEIFSLGNDVKVIHGDHDEEKFKEMQKISN